MFWYHEYSCRKHIFIDIPPDSRTPELIYTCERLLSQLSGIPIKVISSEAEGKPDNVQLIKLNIQPPRLPSSPADINHIYTRIIKPVISSGDHAQLKCNLQELIAVSFAVGSLLYDQWLRSQTPATIAKLCSFPWLDVLIRKIFPTPCKPKPTNYPVLTMDVDVTLAIKGKPPGLILSTLLRWAMFDSPFIAIRRLLEAITHHDPFHCKLSHFPQPSLLPHRIFLHILPEETGQPQTPHIIKEWLHYKSISLIGWHPSIKATSSKENFFSEHQMWTNLFGFSPIAVRTHFLKTPYPELIMWLEDTGIKEDWSFGFNEFPGFRAGTACPFTPYLIPRKRPAHVTLFPVIVMDRHLLHLCQKQSNACALQTIRRLHNYIREFSRGTLFLLWHNNTVRGQEAGWHKLQNMLKDIAEIVNLA